MSRFPKSLDLRSYGIATTVMLLVATLFFFGGAIAGYVQNGRFLEVLSRCEAAQERLRLLQDMKIKVLRLETRDQRVQLAEARDVISQYNAELEGVARELQALEKGISNQELLRQIEMHVSNLRGRGIPGAGSGPSTGNLLLLEHFLDGLTDKTLQTLRDAQMSAEKQARIARKESQALLAGAAILLCLSLLAAILIARQQKVSRSAMEAELGQRTSDLRKANEAKSNFLATITHEIRTPLMTISGYSEILETAANLDGDQRSQVQAIATAANSVGDILSDVLQMSEIEKGEIRLEEAPAVLRKVIEEAAMICRPPDPGVRLELSVDPGLGVAILVDEVRLRQIILNLLVNASKFTPEGVISLSAEIRDGDVIIAVSDTGIGIPSDKIEEIFSPFTQASTGIQRKYGGTGLGLSICRRLAEAMGGSIHAENNQEKGAAFHLRIPFRPVAAEDSETTPSETAETPVRSLNILVVEDNPTNRRLTALLLRRLGHQVATAVDGIDCLEKSASASFDLILLDLEMPNIDGFETCLQIRSIERRDNRPAVKILAFTAHAFREVLDRCTDVGMDGYITKPVKLDSLKSALQKVFS